MTTTQPRDSGVSVASDLALESVHHLYYTAKVVTTQPTGPLMVRKRKKEGTQL